MLICVLKNRRRTPIKMFKEIKVLLFFAKLSIFWQKIIVSGFIASLFITLGNRIWY